MHEYSGVSISNTLDVSQSHWGSVGSTSTDAMTSNASTTTQNNDLIFGARVDSSANMPATTQGTGFTKRQNPAPANGVSMETEDKTQTSAGSAASTFTFAQADVYLAAMAAFKGSGYSASGTLDSVTYDTGVAGGAAYSYIMYNGTLPEARACSSSSRSRTIPPAPSISLDRMAPGTAGSPTVPPIRGSRSNWFRRAPAPRSIRSSTANAIYRYRVNLVADSTKTYTPTVTGVVVNWSP